MIDVQQLLTGALLMLLGSLGTGAVMFAKSLIRMSRDLDAAFLKIRAIEKEFESERASFKGSDCGSRKAGD